MNHCHRKNINSSGLFNYATPLLGGRKTKIICAIGPECETKEKLRSLLDEGMNVARFNLSHGTHETHGKVLKNLREAMAERPDVNCAVLMDTKGPEIRTGECVDRW